MTSAITPADIDFLIIGAAKSATTWLQQQLQAQPGVYMPDPELHFFSRNAGKGMDWYLEQFTPPRADLLIGEKSNSYLDTPGMAGAVHAALPHVRLVAQLRNPVERAYSDYCMLFRRGEVDGDIEAHLDPREAAEGRFLGGGNYATLLEPWIDLYGREALLVLFFEDVKGAPETNVERLFSHIGLEAPAEVASEAKVKDRTSALLPLGMRRRLAWLKPVVRPLRGTAGFEAARGMLAREPEYPALSPDLRARIADHFRPATEALEVIVGHALPEWH